MKIVLDTNVLVSALLNPYGVPSVVWNLGLKRQITFLYEQKILIEYEQVLGRPKFKFTKEQIKDTVDFIKNNGEHRITSPTHHTLPDESDRIFLEMALEVDCQALITGNKKHFPKTKGLNIFTPKEFIDFFLTNT